MPTLLGMNFPLNTAFVASYKFWKVVFSFSFSSKHLNIFLEIYLLTHVLFRSMLFNLQLFGGFPDIFLLLTSSLILL